jgi:pimeloyl-ACP methyl ester carboxylesterase
MLWNILLVAAGLYVAVALFFYVFQRSFIYMPTAQTAEHAEALVLERPDARILISCQQREGPQAVLFFGGNAEDVGITVPKLAELFPDRAIYGMHYRGYSGSSGRPSEPALRGDAAAVFAMVHQRHPDVMLIGRSLGSSLAVGVAAEGPVSSLVLIAPFESIQRIAQRTAPFLPMWLLLKDRYDSWRYAPRVKCPTLLLAASDDEIVPMADTERLRDAFPPGIATLRVMPGTDHNTVASVPEFYEALLEGSWQDVSDASRNTGSGEMSVIKAIHGPCP